MIHWFKDVWLNLRKSNGMPGNRVLIPMEEQKVSVIVDGKKSEVTTPITDKPKRKYTRKKKDVTNTPKTE